MENDYEKENLSESSGYVKQSHKKYGGYNGWRDNQIDETFDGQPDASWNLD